VFLFYGGFHDPLAHLSLSWRVRKRMLLDMPDRMRRSAMFRHGLYCSINPRGENVERSNLQRHEKLDTALVVGIIGQQAS